MPPVIDAVRVTRGLSGHELYRLLNSGKLSSRILAELWMNEADEADYLAEIAAEGGKRHYSRLEAYMRANPLHTCAPKPAGWGQEYDDIPF